MLRLVLVGCGGFVGALARYGLILLAGRITAAGFPLATLTVNLVGSFGAGCLMGLFDAQRLPDPEARLLLLVGVLGSFTTFSAFSYENLVLLRGGRNLWLFANIALTLGGTLLAVYLGWRMTRPA